MVKTPMLSQEQKESQWQQERQSLLEQLKLTAMARWIIKVSKKFTPLYSTLKTHLLEQVVVQADETPLNVLKEDKSCYMQLYCLGSTRQVTHSPM